MSNIPTQPEGADQADDARTQLLLRMYDQMFNDINRHIMVIWQSVGTLVAAFAVFALAEKDVITIDVATTLIVLIASWQLAHVYDSSYWYNRNLVIIANIERQFLLADDLHTIHYYFGKHRKTVSMLHHLRIQWYLGVSIALLVLAYHFIHGPLTGTGGVARMLPYVVGAVSCLLLAWLRRNRMDSYREFLANSPGVDMETKDVRYGVGHPTEKGAGGPSVGKADWRWWVSRKAWAYYFVTGLVLAATYTLPPVVRRWRFSSRFDSPVVAVIKDGIPYRLKESFDLRRALKLTNKQPDSYANPILFCLDNGTYVECCYVIAQDRHRQIVFVPADLQDNYVLGRVRIFWHP